MELVFLRHGDAEDVGPDGSDFGRRLTARGESESTRVATFILDSGLVPEKVVTSPLTRAQQTADVVTRALGHELLAQADDRLKSGARLADVESLVTDFPCDRLLLIGHEPDFSKIVSTLIGGGRVAMKKSGAACVSLRAVQPGAGELQWLIRPDLVCGT